MTDNLYPNNSGSSGRDFRYLLNQIKELQNSINSLQQELEQLKSTFQTDDLTANTANINQLDSNIGFINQLHTQLLEVLDSFSQTEINATNSVTQPEIKATNNITSPSGSLDFIEGTLSNYNTHQGTNANFSNLEITAQALIEQLHSIDQIGPWQFLTQKV